MKEESLGRKRIKNTRTEKEGEEKEEKEENGSREINRGQCLNR